MCASRWTTGSRRGIRYTTLSSPSRARLAASHASSSWHMLLNRRRNDVHRHLLCRSFFVLLASLPTGWPSTVQPIIHGFSSPLTEHPVDALYSLGGGLEHKVTRGLERFPANRNATKAQFIEVHGPNGPRVTWAERTAAGVDPKH